MPSIRLRLLKWLIGPILLLNLAGGVLTYLLAWVPAQSAFDQGLVDAAGALGARVQAGDSRGGARIDLPPQAEQVLRADQSDAVYFAVREGDRLLAGDADFPSPQRSAGVSADAAQAAPSGRSGAADATQAAQERRPGQASGVSAGRQISQTYDGTMRGEPVRIVALRSGQGEGAVEIGVAKTLRKRQQIRSATFRALLLLETLLTLASVGLIWFSVSSGLLPLLRMRGDLNGRNIAAAGDLASDLTPIPDGAVPYELAPVVGAFNGLLERLRTGARAQHAFLADVAHQLRTPLAGLQTQLEWLQKRHAGEPDSARSIDLMLSSTERMIRQTNQLLALARAEPSHFERTRLEPLRLDALVAESVQHFVGEAAKKSIDLGFELSAATVLGDRFLLRDLVDNLIDNAIRYTPDGGVVTVFCTDGTFAVEDSGPGIPPARREQVFQRFVRLDDKSTGSGLGLAIVRDIALAHGAVVTITSATDGQGARFAVVFPPVPA